MKILIWSKPFYPSLGGVEETTRAMAITLCRLGHSPFIVTDTLLGNNNELNEGYEIYRDCSWFKLLRLSRTCDLVITKGGVSAVAGMAAFFSHRPLIIIHETSGSYQHEGRNFYTIVGNLARWFTCIIAKMHVGVSNSTLKSKALPFPKKAFVLINCISASLRERTLMPLTFTERNIDIFFAGRLIKSKGIYVLADALKILSNDNLKLNVTIAGDGPELNKLKRVLQEQTTHNIEFVGVVRGDSLADLYSHSRLLVIPTTSHPEGMPVVIAEAISFGVPVIGSDQPAISESVGNAGILFPLGDSTALAAALRLILLDEECYLRLHQNCVNRKYLFSYERYQIELAQLLREAFQAN